MWLVIISVIIMLIGTALLFLRRTSSKNEAISESQIKELLKNKNLI